MCECMWVCACVHACVHVHKHAQISMHERASAHIQLHLMSPDCESQCNSLQSSSQHSPCPSNFWSSAGGNGEHGDYAVELGTCCMHTMCAHKPGGVFLKPSSDKVPLGGPLDSGSSFTAAPVLLLPGACSWPEPGGAGAAGMGFEQTRRARKSSELTRGMPLINPPVFRLFSLWTGAASPACGAPGGGIAASSRLPMLGPPLDK